MYLGSKKKIQKELLGLVNSYSCIQKSKDLKGLISRLIHYFFNNGRELNIFDSAIESHGKCSVIPSPTTSYSVATS